MVPWSSVCQRGRLFLLRKTQAPAIIDAGLGLFLCGASTI